MYIHPEARNYLSIKIASDNIPAVLDQMEKVYSDNVPGRKMEYSFLDEDFDKQYQIEDRFQRIFSLFAAVGIVISWL